MSTAMVVGLVLIGSISSSCGRIITSEGTENEYIAECPCTTDAPELFSPAVFPSGPPMVPAQEADLLDRSELELLWSSSPSSQAFFHSLPLSLKEQVPELATAIAVLANTSLGQGFRSSFEALGSSPSVRFGALPDSQAGSFDVEKSVVTINDRYRFEHPLLLSSVLAHELVHHDSADGRPEEALALIIEMFTLLELTRDHVEVISSGTELARRQSTSLLLSVFNSETLVDGATVPGRDDKLSVYSALPYPQVPSPSSALLEEFLGILSIDVGRQAEFSRKTVALVNLSKMAQVAATTEGIRAVARVLRLEPYAR